MATINWKIIGGPGPDAITRALSEPYVFGLADDGMLTSIRRMTRFTANTIYHDGLYVDIKGADREQAFEGKLGRLGGYLWKLRGEFLVYIDLTGEHTHIPESMVGTFVSFEMEYDPHRREGKILFEIPD